MTHERMLFIPVETKVRELDAKILLSCHAAQAGMTPVLGMQSELLRLVKFLPRGIYLEKGMTPLKREGVVMLQALGNRVVAWCEEGLVIVNQETYARDRVDADVFSRFDAFYAWGKVQGQAIRLKVGDAVDNILLTGNPRFDLLRAPYKSVFQKEADELRREHGRFILVNTNFGLYNSFYGPAYFVEKMMRSHNRIQDAAHEQFLNDYMNHVKAVYEHFLEMLPDLCKAFPEYAIILRPHPSENHDNYRKLVPGLRNLKVIHKGNVVPWLLASEVLIHNACTTGVEAYVLGKPVVAYRPVRSDVFEYELPMAVSVPAFSVEELKGKVAAVMAGEKETAPGAAIGLNYAANITGRLSCTTIVDSLHDIYSNKSVGNRLNARSMTTSLKWMAKDLKYGAKVAANRLINRKQEDIRYMKQKIPDITLQEVRDKVLAFQEADGGLAGVTVDRLMGSRYCFCFKSLSSRGRRRSGP